MRAHTTSFSMICDPASVPAARRRVSELTADWGLRLNEDSALALTTVVSEMVTNALQHGDGGEFTVKVKASPMTRRILIEVHDGSSALPRTLSATDDAEDGRGMWLIQELAAASGAQPTRRGKRVWATIAIPEQPLTRTQFFPRTGRATRAVVGRLIRPGRRRIPADAQTS